MKVLIIQTAFLGDAIISLSLAEELRRLSPEAEISYLVRPEFAAAIKLSPSVNKVFTFDKYNTESGLEGIQKKASELNTEQFDIVFTFHNSKRTIMLIERLNAGQKIGYGENKVLTHNVREVQEPHTAKAIRLLQAILPEANVKTLPKLQPLESSLPKELLNLPRPIIAIAPDSVWKTKQWGIENFLALMNRLLNEKHSIVVIGNNSKLHLFDIHKSLNTNMLNLLSQTSIEGLAAVISYSDILISNDSAPVHIATATNTPSVVIFGPTVSDFGFAPPQELGIVIENKELWCRPCASHGSNECPIHTHECMSSISPDIVFESAMLRLSLS